MDLDAFSLAKRFAHVGPARVAYREEGTGPAAVLLHGCPFSSFVWRTVLPALAAAGTGCWPLTCRVSATPKHSGRGLVAACPGSHGDR